MTNILNMLVHSVYKNVINEGSRKHNYYNLSNNNVILRIIKTFIIAKILIGNQLF